MTTPQDPQPIEVSGGDMSLQPGKQLVVTSRTREPFPRGFGTVVLAIIVAMLCGYVAILLVREHRGDMEREQLACQVQRLGGQPVGDVRCPPARKPTATPTPRLTPTPVAGPSASAPVVVIVTIPGSPGPAGPRGADGSSQPGQPSRRATASPTATRSASPAASPVVQVCLPGLPCVPPRGRSSPGRR